MTATIGFKVIVEVERVEEGEQKDGNVEEKEEDLKGENSPVIVGTGMTVGRREEPDEGYG